jgi:type IV pilus assembly protein PilA
MRLANGPSSYSSVGLSARETPNRERSEERRQVEQQNYLAARKNNRGQNLEKRRAKMTKVMKQLRKFFRHGGKGFTLIEMLVVVGILAVLAAVVIPQVTKFVHTGDLAAANTELAVVQTAQAGYMAEHGNVATQLQADLVPYANKPFHGTYAFNADGSINPTGTTYDAFTLDAGTMQFK